MEGSRQLLTPTLFLSFAIAAFAAWAPAAASSQERKEYVPTAEKKDLLREDLFAIPGKEAHISRLQLPPGWVGKRHFHTGDVFVYVLRGEFAVDAEGRGRLTFRTGEVYHEAVNTVMQARNLSTREPTEILLFQVSNKGEPLMILAPPHPDNE